MKTIALAELPTKRKELLDGLAQGGTFAVTDEGKQIAMLVPPVQVTVGAAAANGSVFDEIVDLIGMVDGPRDLSNKKKHLGGFGLDGDGRREDKRHTGQE